MRSYPLAIALLASPAAAQMSAPMAPQIPIAPLATPTVWNPVADYITTGQDEPG